MALENESAAEKFVAFRIRGVSELLENLEVRFRWMVRVCQ